MTLSNKPMNTRILRVKQTAKYQKLNQVLMVELQLRLIQSKQVLSDELSAIYHLWKHFVEMFVLLTRKAICRHFLYIAVLFPCYLNSINRQKMGSNFIFYIAWETCRKNHNIFIPTRLRVFVKLLTLACRWHLQSMSWIVFPSISIHHQEFFTAPWNDLCFGVYRLA